MTEKNVTTQADAKYKSQREKHYYEEILPKLSAGIIYMDLGMRANTVLVNAGIYNVAALRKAIESEQHIRYLDKEDLEYIKSCLQIK